MKHLKKLLLAALVCAVAAGSALSLTACGGTATEPTASETSSEAASQPAVDADTPLGSALASFQKLVDADPTKSPAELAQAMAEDESLPFAGASMEVEPGLLNGFTKEIAFSKGAMFGPMIGSIPYIGYIFQITDSDEIDPAAFLQQLNEAADLNWNICTKADEKGGVIAGDLVCFVMAPAAFEE